MTKFRELRPKRLRRVRSDRIHAVVEQISDELGHYEPVGPNDAAKTQYRSVFV